MFLYLLHVTRLKHNKWMEGMALRGALGPLSGLICEIFFSVDQGNLSQIWTFVTKKSGKNYGISETSGCDNHDNEQ